jgi:epoxyqueuosine reductase
VNIESFAKKLGFHLVRVIPYSLPETDARNYKNWLEKGYAGGLEYMKNSPDKRTDARKVLPEVKGVICLAMNYYQSFPDTPDYDCGKVARYAWGKDYHRVIEKKLKKIRKYIIDESGGKLNKRDFKLYVDAGPILERAYARKAGFGFTGKNSTLITKKYGSWVFLAEILVAAELEYSKILDETKGLSCGSCTRCMDACPAKAIVKPYTVDVKKCISYQTIENRKEIPPGAGVRENLNKWIFGCDICQQVCPHNCRALETDIPEFLNHIAGPYVNLNELQKMDLTKFNEKFAGSPLKRAGLKKLKQTSKYVKLGS